MLQTVDHVLAAGWLPEFLLEIKNYFLIFLGFSLVIFFHELGHFLAARMCDVRVDKFAVGFGRTLMAYRKGIGFRFGQTAQEAYERVAAYINQKRGGQEELPALTEADIAAARQELGIGETEYAFNLLPLGGYVKMLGQEDFAVDKSGELKVKDDPRAFTHKSVGQRMFIVSAGVIMNLIFAAFVFMIVFLAGVDFPPSTIGLILPESPADRAGLRPGDKILEINGQHVSDFNDVMPAVMLADPNEPVVVKVLRTAGDQQQTLTFNIPPERNTDENKLQIGVSPQTTSRVADVFPDALVPAEQQLQRQDVIKTINGKPVTNLYEINHELVKLRGQFGDMVVERTLPDGTVKTVDVRRRARLAFRPTGPVGRESGHLLGLVPRREITVVIEGERAHQAGIRPGDVVVRWAQQIAPTLAEILDSTAANPERDIKVTVLRTTPDGESREIDVTVRPKAQGLFKQGKARVGITPSSQEEARLVVADIVTHVTPEIATPAAKLKEIMPRGSLITKVNDEPVQTWSQLTEKFIALAGQEVKLTWTFEGQAEQHGTIYIPHTIGTTFQLPPDHLVTSIGGERRIEDVVDGRKVSWSAENWNGAREMLRRHIGQEIKVEHRGILDEKGVEETITVTPEMLDTWVQRIEYQVIDTLITEPVLAKTKVDNPLVAMKIGLMKTYYFIEQVYKTMKSMIVTRSLGFEQVSGPIGIVKMGSDIAGQDFVKLLYFLALISANLAVINFLPLPIVDGGLFLFLIIEKIKGSPISLRVVIATQVIGLVLIAGVFLFVTFQDLQKFFG